MATYHSNQNNYWYQYIRHEDPKKIEAALHEEFISTKHDKIHLDIFGHDLGNNSKGNVIMIHGTSVYSRFYAEFAYLLKSNGFRVFVPDLPGHGQSSGIRGHFTMKKITDSIEFITAHIKERYPGKIAIMGSSLGGISSLYAVAANSKIDLAICHNAAIFNEGHHKEIIKIGAFLRLIVPLVPFFAKIFPKLKMSVFKYLPKKSLVSTEYGSKLFDNLIQDPLIASKYTLISLKTQIVEAPKCPPEEIQIPIMFINGENDKLFSVTFLKALFQRLPNQENEFQVIEGADHLIFQENTTEVVSRVIPFLSKHL
ncbi:2-succinyl-6-hydroxy-2,4-cyclohexadiene-1-carboxylate synthase [Candidatus Lokiarchaeum ossiferum]|uniref:2-succinyl-6-hydroxy-2, 4-cyclohexadiene-1-carboxylate synthase n=1 Tax=Candidatus Lokiarchaeum ossiferum TaxID=2951803 RepID=A0ABY6HM43_9ARCH|nr:2-succinyl-6-hydroxy-2,4-cyclohexadiene-1-carboxylate synthase [Candidatus Lokiarchaeum sp. B-35]